MSAPITAVDATFGNNTQSLNITIEHRGAPPMFYRIDFKDRPATARIANGRLHMACQNAIQGGEHALAAWTRKRRASIIRLD